MESHMEQPKEWGRPLLIALLQAMLFKPAPL